MLILCTEKKGFTNYQIFIEDKNKNTNELIEEEESDKQRRLYSALSNSSLPPHKVGYTPRKIEDK